MNNVEIIIILDKSGSMESVKSDAIGGYNSFITDQKKLPGIARVTLALFNDTYEIVYDGVDIHSVPPLDEHSYIPGGMTAMLDAIGRTIDSVGDRLAKTPDRDRPNGVIVAILTDGLENASREYTHEQVSDKIKHQSEKYSWQFVYLGANQDVIQEAAKIGVSMDNAILYASTAAGTAKVLRTVGSAVTNYRNYGRIHV